MRPVSYLPDANDDLMKQPRIEILRCAKQGEKRGRHRKKDGNTQLLKSSMLIGCVRLPSARSGPHLQPLGNAYLSKDGAAEC
jgi:hypothetical protein